MVVGPLGDHAAQHDPEDHTSPECNLVAAGRELAWAAAVNAWSAAPRDGSRRPIPRWMLVIRESTEMSETGQEAIHLSGHRVRLRTRGL